MERNKEKERERLLKEVGVTTYPVNNPLAGETISNVFTSAAFSEEGKSNWQRDAQGLNKGKKWEIASQRYSPAGSHPSSPLLSFSCALSLSFSTKGAIFGNSFSESYF